MTVQVTAEFLAKCSEGQAAIILNIERVLARYGRVKYVDVDGATRENVETGEDEWQIEVFAEVVTDEAAGESFEVAVWAISNAYGVIAWAWKWTDEYKANVAECISRDLRRFAGNLKEDTPRIELQSA